MPFHVQRLMVLRIENRCSLNEKIMGGTATNRIAIRE
jgi:hypothetical protein